MKRLKTVAVVILILLPLDIGVARFCKANCDFWQSTYPTADHRVRSEAYHHTFAANRRVTEAWGNARYRYATNSLGFKDSEPRTVDLRGSRPKVLFLGDSFTEGKGFPYEKTFVGMIGKELAGQGVEVLNGGVDSYAPVIYRLKVKHLLEKVGLRLDAVVVFLDVSDIYDQARRYRVDPDGRLVVPPPEKKPATARIGRVLRDNSAVARLVSIVADTVGAVVDYGTRRLEIAKRAGKPVWDVDAMDMWVYWVTRLGVSAWTYDDAHWQAFGKLGRARAAADMEGLLALLRKRGIPLVVAVYPWPDQLYHDPDAPRHQGFWRDWSAARGVPFVSLFPAFTEAKPEDVLKRYFIPFDFHWNAEGHKLVAETFLKQYAPPRR